MISSFTLNNHVSRLGKARKKVFMNFKLECSKYLSLKLKNFEFEEIQCRFKSSSSLKIKLKKAQIKNTQKFQVIFEF